MTDLLKLLESSDPRDVELSKQKFHEQFHLVKEAWLVNGLYDHYLSTNSTRSMEILVNVREPHHVYLFDKITESIKGSKHDVKVQGLTLLGHIVRREPAWLYKITQHQLMRDVLKLLKNENDILILLSALMALIVLLPIIPSLMGNFLQDVFEIFSRLAAWNCNNPVLEEQMVHMQMALYALFQRLYGMYPCNFLAYLRDQYRNKDLSPIFTHTIKPMLDTVKMHPLLITTSKTNETTTERWKKMGAHDIIVECERFSLDVPDRCSHESCFVTSSRSRSSTVNSSSYVESPYQLQLLRNTQASVVTFSGDRDFFSPLLHCQTPPVNETSMPTPIPHSHFQSAVQTTMITSVTHISQENSSPPEAAIEATPETTPIRDVRLTNRVHPTNTSVVRALTTFNSRVRPIGSGNNTPTHSQPSSPMRKEVSPFNFPPDNKYASAFGNPKSNRLFKMVQDRSQMGEMGTGDGNSRSKTPLMAPTSPLKIISSPDFGLPSSPLFSQRIDSPLSQEDEEVLSIVGHGDITQHPGLRQCDSVLHELEGFRGNDEDVDNCEQEHGSPCTAGGLHMPNSRSMIDFAKRVRRLRYHSQCGGESEKNDTSMGSSSPWSNALCNLTVRRANSCPEMKKSPAVPAIDNINKTLDETEEDISTEYPEIKPFTNGIDSTESKSNKKPKIEKIIKLATSETQTENFWPMPYEHLFLGIFPSLENNEVKPSPSQSPAPLTTSQEKTQSATVYDILDKYIETAVHSNEKDPVKHLKDQLQLLYQQLLFERHRREIHAFRNRRLLADARNTRALEEHNSALRDQVQLKQKDIDSLKEHLEHLRKEKHVNESKTSDKYWEAQCLNLQKECRSLKAKNEDLQKEMVFLRSQCSGLDNKWQASESALLNASAEVKIAREQAVAGERGRVELEQVNKELLLLGELLLKYQERLNDLPVLRKTELNKLVESYKHEVKVLNQQLESKIANLEAYRVRILELENIIQHHDESNAVQKRMLNDVKEECHEKLMAVESKYQTQLAANRYLEEKILELFQRLEISAKKPIYSPDTSSCHEVNATLTDRTSTATGISPHSSPLSASLASSDGSMAFMIPDVKDMKNLQAIVDQKEPICIKPAEENIQTTNDMNSSKQQLPSSSTKYD